MNKPLTLQEFETKHALKFKRDKLSRAEKRKRYDDYLRTVKDSATSHVGHTTVSRMPPAKRKAPSRKSIRLKQTDCVKRYLQSVCDPFAFDAAVPIPSVVPDITPTSCFQHREILQVDIISGVGNSLMSVMTRGDVTRFKQINHVDTSTNEFFLVPPVADGANNSMIGWFQVQEIYADIRVVSAGIRVRFTGPPVDAKGVLAASMLPPSFSPDNQVITFDNIAQLPWTKVGPAIDGIEIIGIPAVLDAPYRRTSSRPNFVTGQNAAGDCWDGPNNFASNPGPAELEQYLDFVMHIDPTLYTSTTQLEYNDAVRDPCYPMLWVGGYNLPGNASFEVEIVYNFEGHLRLQSNTFGTPSQANTTPALADATKIAAAAQALKLTSEHVGVASTRASPGLSKATKSPNWSSIFNSAISAAPSVASFVNSALDATAMASGAVAAASPALESALPVVAGLLAL